MKTKFLFSCVVLLSLVGLLPIEVIAQRQIEKLDRGVMAMRTGPDSAFISWRLLGTESKELLFNIYRKTGNGAPVKLNQAPLGEGTNYMDTKVDFSQPNSYFVKAVSNKKEQDASKAFIIPANQQVQQYLSIPLRTIPGYSPGDASVGDLDGDGEYEIVLHQTGKGADNSFKGFTTEPIFQAYKLNGTFLWQIKLGRNIREGAHYTQFMVYDLDGDGKAEFACKTADGTIDGKGNVIGDSTKDHRNTEGHVVRGPEFLTIFSGLTGEKLATTSYIPPRHPAKEDPTPEEMAKIWGDGRANRSERYLACVAYLDGQRPSLVFCRGYYTRTVLAAWNWRDGKLTPVWTFDSNDGTPGNEIYRGQGNHNLSVGDVDMDGKDEIMYGAAAIDHNGKGLYSTGFGHADAMHFSDLDPDNPGLEVFNIQEKVGDAGMNFREAGTGKILWKIASAPPDSGQRGKIEGTVRAASFDIDPRYRGDECWVYGRVKGLYDAKGNKIGDKIPRCCNFAVWWDGDLLRELLDRNYIAKWNWNTQEQETLLTAFGCNSINGTKATPNLSADLLGDWREEVIWRSQDGKELRVYTTTIPTNYRFTTLMHDPIYRLGIAWQNVAYNQPPHLSYYLNNK